MNTEHCPGCGGFVSDRMHYCQACTRRREIRSQLDAEADKLRRPDLPNEPKKSAVRGDYLLTDE